MTTFAVISYFVIPESKWLPSARLAKFVESTGIDETVGSSLSNEAGVEEVVEHK